jgi:hypothetical protein
VDAAVVGGEDARCKGRRQGRAERLLGFNRKENRNILATQLVYAYVNFPPLRSISTAGLFFGR